MAKRRFQKKGYVYRRGDTWFGQFREDTNELDENGRFKRRVRTKTIGPATGPGKLTEKRARIIFYDKYLADLHKSGPMSSMRVEQFVREYFEPTVVLRCKPTGQSHYRNMLYRHVIPALGEYELGEIRPQQVYNLIMAKLKWKNKDGKGLSIQTIHHIRNTVSAVFRHAKRMQAYSGDLPTEGVRLPTLGHAERRALTWDQVRAIAAVIGYPDPEKERKKKAAPVDMAKCAADNLQLGALVRVLALTGLRIGEAMGLRWRDVDLDGGLLRVRENFVRGKYGTLKTAKSRRDVPLHSIAIAELRKLVPDVGLSQAGRLSGSPSATAANLDTPVFAGRESGKPLDQHNIAARFLRPAGKRAGVPWVSWHVLRHTNSTLAHAVGLSIEQRQKVLGHAAPQMTAHYTHPELDAVRQQMEKIGRPN